MRTDFSAQLLATSAGARANEILRACVHCGFCNATCPTYQITGDELDGPRGRIYLMRELLENGSNQERAEQHLDRCLTCRACETTCPSGVAYGELVDIARESLGPRRRGMQGVLRGALKWMVPRPGRLRFMARLGRMFRWFVPGTLKKSLPPQVGKALRSTSAENSTATRKVILLNGCAQQVSTPGTNEHLLQLLQAHGIEVITLREEVCCGGLDLHLGDADAAGSFMRRNVDALLPHLEEVEAIISAASGCGVTVKDYGRMLAEDAIYAPLAQAVTDKVQDISEFLAACDLPLTCAREERRIAWHSPCTLQHGQQITDVVELLLTSAGYQLCAVTDSHLCCGSAGTYSILQPELSEQLKQNKLTALLSDEPQLIATANVGCQTHLGSDSDIDVVHWIELLN